MSHPGVAERAPPPADTAERPVGTLFERLLDIAREESGMDLAWISEFVDGEQRVRFTSGAIGAFNTPADFASRYDSSYCARVLDGRLPGVIADARGHEVASLLPLTEELGIGSYVGVPVRRPDGDIYGMLCCISRGPTTTPPPMRLLTALAEAAGEEAAVRRARLEPMEAKRRRIELALREGGLQTVLQPVVQLSRMRIVGVEALSRFNGPPAGPDAWFADAAEVGLGEELELAAIKSALALLPALPADVYLALNASPSTALSPALARLLGTVDVSRLTLELTEHSAVASYEALGEALAPLRAAGMRVAVDDAGAGFASFNHILLLRPDIIKLDIRLTRGVDRDIVKQSLAESLASFAFRTGAVLVAEGVETQGELDTLLRLGATAVQGYFLARPQPLPLPTLQARPKGLLAGASVDTGTMPTPELVAFVLAEVSAVTGFEIAYMTVLHTEAGLLEHRYVHPPGLSVPPKGLCIPWNDSICARCRHAGVVWTADLGQDLAAGYFGEDLGVKTFLSMPIRTPARQETLGTLCAAAFESHYLSDRTVARVEHLARQLADRILLDGIEQFAGQAPIHLAR